MPSINKNKTLLQEMKAVLRRQGYAYATENSYCDWVSRFIRFHKVKSRSAMLDSPENNVETFLTHLAVDKNMAPSTQNQALNALVFLFSKVLGRPLENVSATRSRKEPRIPVVLSKDEVKQVLACLDGTTGLIVKVLYAGGLRISEVIRLRVQDVDFSFKQITVRDGKGKKNRVTPLANQLAPLLQAQIEKVKLMHEKDLVDGYGSVYLPYALSKKYPDADKAFGWQYVFPGRNVAIDPRSGIERRHHTDASVVNKAIKRAVNKCGLVKKVSAHTFRHSFATHLLQTGTDIRTIQALLGHADLQTTIIYTHVLRQGGQGVKSPFDDLWV